MLTLTPEQIKNWRNAIAFQYGCFASWFLSDEDIVNYANRLQNALNEYSRIHWNIKIRTDQDSDRPWEQIAKEPKNPYMSRNEINRACWSLFEHYPAIVAIQIIPTMTPEEAEVLERKKDS